MLRETKFRYVWERPKSGAGPYTPSDAKVKINYASLDEIEKGKRIRPSIYPDRLYSILVARQEFTGLKDSKGREIYEGDILGIINPSKAGMCWEVSWHDFGWQILLHNFDNPAPYYVRAGRHLSDHEVIGNIYENPGLLSQRKETPK